MKRTSSLLVIAVPILLGIAALMLANPAFSYLNDYTAPSTGGAPFVDMWAGTPQWNLNPTLPPGKMTGTQADLRNVVIASFNTWKTAPNTSNIVSGVRQFTGGEENFLFLQPSQDNDGTMIVTGLVLGNFRLYRTNTGQVAASNGVPEVSAVQVGTGAVSTYRGSTVTVDQLESRIQKAVQQ